MYSIEALILGESAPIRRMRSLIARIAPTSLPVLVQGPSGSGKEFVASALHAASARSGRFIALNVWSASTDAGMRFRVLRWDSTGFSGSWENVGIALADTPGLGGHFCARRVP
jgi:transcriptional regulator of acetoin/glycerol metabolism